MVAIILNLGYISFTEVNPDKGTETLPEFDLDLLCDELFTEVNPDKGTETTPHNRLHLLIFCLQKLTPIRGRKLPVLISCYTTAVSRLQKLTPIRGRKPAPVTALKSSDIVYRS